MAATDNFVDIAPDILKGGAQEDRGETARMQYFIGAIAVGDLLKSTLGPKGMDKLLQPMNMEGSRGGTNVVTNDGATILKSVWLNNPAARVLVDVSMQQDAQCGDGTTGVVVLASELLRGAEKLIEQKIHPQTICLGFRKALRVARERLEAIKFSRISDPEQFEQDLLHIAETTLSSKLLRLEKEHFAQLTVKALLRMYKELDTSAEDASSHINLSLIQIIKKPGGTLKDSYLEDGFVLEKKIGVGQPKRMENCKILIANTPMDTDKVKIYGVKVNVDSFQAVQDLELSEKQKMKDKVDRILKHGCNVFINRQLIYNYPDQLFKEAGVMAIEHSDFDGMERLAACLGGDIVSTFDTPESVKMGTCKTIEEILIGEDRLIRFSGCAKGGACSIILRGASSHVLDEAERSLHDALAVISETLSDGGIVCGGGCAELEMAEAVENYAKTVDGKESLAVEAFAHALRALPGYILSNGGFDSADILCRLKAAHASGNSTAGIDIELGDVGNMMDIGVFESFKSKLSQICLATEAAESIVRVDDIIKCAPRERAKGV
ncbi:chaperonin containing t-complex protein 1, beta subunit, putative [Theileria equi strain WA]|uniref:CCT-beta n=1 Tax=Theileria equi strain WA TaxID=1537102 RepID=L1LDC9_THEEQ|nr:chaperonin containing t-complex protein 1, beta subunit, putative [Theileria equi strain WA]EKX73183.1 chaperonin containing t-complex protein 1, beta subunit, putative [Theileria equi strain WA]|eukprot:XP_004832635.1 chaperonin containing t-complex protein 1, beta subunit, putative [Theileria equi strain WA]